MAAGTINTIVGAGTLNTFPTLLFFGYPPLVANVSNTVGLVAGGITGIHGYRRELAGLGDLLRRLMPVSLVGALTGAILLLWLPESAFDAIVPVLLALSLLLVLLGPRLQPRAEQNEQQRQGEEDRHDGIERRFGEPEQKDGTGQGANKRDRHQPPQEVAQAGQLSAVAMNTRDAACDEANGVGNVGDQRRIPEEQQRRERDQRAGTDDGVDRPRSHSRREQRDDFIPRHPVTLGEDDRAPCGVAVRAWVDSCHRRRSHAAPSRAARTPGPRGSPLPGDRTTASDVGSWLRAPPPLRTHRQPGRGLRPELWPGPRAGSPRTPWA